jgi:hypothetical protein
LVAQTQRDEAESAVWVAGGVSLTNPRFVWKFQKNKRQITKKSQGAIKKALNAF